MTNHMTIRVFRNIHFCPARKGKRPLSGENWFMTSIELLHLVGPGFLSIFEKKKLLDVAMHAND